MAKYLSLEEEAILRFYTTNAGYKNFNKALRGEIEMTEEFKIQKELMNKALDKLPKYQSNELLYRIETLSEEQITKIYKVGNIIENKQFTSTTYSETAIERGIEHRGATLLLRIEGKNGRLIEDLSTLKIEREVLFKSNTKFIVKEVGFAPNPYEPWVPIKRVILVEK
ncbi:ADP-ribosyltransferase [Chryseobacterium sp. SN22]|nr:ADP-ribosyltransferase [Chryseobacterium sp. SN22]